MSENHIPNAIVVSYRQSVAARDDDGVVDTRMTITACQLLDELIAGSAFDVVKSVETYLGQFNVVFLRCHLSHLRRIPQDTRVLALAHHLVE